MMVSRRLGHFKIRNVYPIPGFEPKLRGKLVRLLGRDCALVCTWVVGDRKQREHFNFAPGTVDGHRCR